MTANRRRGFAVVFAALMTLSMGMLGFHGAAQTQMAETPVEGVQDSSELNLTASGSDVVVPGHNVTANFTLTNTGDQSSTASAIELVSVPGEWEVVDQSAGPNVTWSEARSAWLSETPLAPGESVSVSVTFQLSNDSATTEYYVSARASDADGASSSAAESFPVGRSDGTLGLETSVADAAAPGENVTMDVTLSNDGDNDSTASVVSLVVPRGWSVVDQSAGEGVTYSEANTGWLSETPLAPGESTTVSAVLRPSNDVTAGEHLISVRASDADNRSATTVARVNVSDDEATVEQTTEADDSEATETVEEMTETVEETTETAAEMTETVAETTEAADSETVQTTAAGTETADMETTQDASLETTEAAEAETTETADMETTEGVDTETTEAADAETVQTESSENVSATFVDDGESLADVTLEVADDPAERRQGLMNRSSLPENHGMVFVYDDAETRSFWMKNTLIPLDMIFVDENGTVLNVEHADPPEDDVPDEELQRYQSDGPAKYVIELEQGFVNETGIEPGTQVEFDVEGSLEPSDETTTES